MRWVIYLLAAMVAELVAIPAAFILPIWCKGSWPAWAAWFATPDNPPEGDFGHRTRWLSKPLYWQRVAWLLRNRAYGFKWTVLAAPMRLEQLSYTGDLRINRNNGRYGLLTVRMGKYWQWKLVKPIGFGRCAMLNFGWLLDDFSKPKALFLFSPRFPSIKNA